MPSSPDYYVKDVIKKYSSPYIKGNNQRKTNSEKNKQTNKQTKEIRNLKSLDHKYSSEILYTW